MTDKPRGLIKNSKIEPVNTVDMTKSMVSEKSSRKKVAKNQDSNIKVSRDTKNQIDILMKLTDNKFSYEMIESLIDNYVDNALDADKKRAFKTLTNL